MFKNYCLIAFRNFVKHKAHSAINIAGLSIGMACFILLFLFVRFELEFDSSHEKSDRIYRVYLETRHNGESFLMAPTMLPLAPALEQGFAEIEHAVRISKKSSFLVSSGEHKHYESVYFADPEVFSVFTYEFKKGNPAAALSQPNRIVITESAAQKYFGRAEAVGRTLKINNSIDFTVSGVLKDLPDNSHFSFNLLADMTVIRNLEKDRWDSWDRFSNDYTYILVRPGTNPADLESRFPEFLSKYVNPEEAKNKILYLQKLRDIHFSDLNYDFAWTHPKSYLLAFTAIGFFILLIACANFMNLTTARSTGRAREVGMRKVVGARRDQLIQQFLLESLILSFTAAAAAVGIVRLLLPWFRQFIHRDIAFDLTGDPAPWIMLLLLALFTGLISGSYPAFMLSAFQPIRTFRQSLAGSVRRLSLRTVFVVMQFAISITLIISTLTVYRQLQFMKAKDLGYQSDQIVVIPLQNSPLRKNPELFRTELISLTGVESASSSNGTPGSGRSNASNYMAVTPQGEKDIYFKIIHTDFDFLKTYGLAIVEGRNFSRDFSTDAGGAVLINESAAKKIGGDSLLGVPLKQGNEIKWRIIGIVKDFHYDSTQIQIDPMLININPNHYEYISVRVRPDSMDRTLAAMESKWKEFAPEYPFEHFVINEQLQNYYRFEKRLWELFRAFSLLAIFISCLGVLGLISFTAEQTQKEIGIRKVLGASAAGIIVMLSKQFVRWVLIANLFAWPVAWILMNNWLQEFAYRTSLSPGIFLLAGFAALLIALASIAYQAVKAASADPVDSLRYE